MDAKKQFSCFFLNSTHIDVEVSFYLCCQPFMIVEHYILSKYFFPLSPTILCLDGPKHTEIMRAAEQPNGGSSVRLICSSHSYPPIKSYRWYKKAEKHETTDKKMSDRQNHTVFSNEPGIYYCVAKNEISEMLSDPVQLFVDREWIQGCVSVCVLFIACWRFCEIIHFFLSSLDVNHLFTNFVSTLSLQTTGGIVKALQIFFPVLIILVILIFFVYR